jgi:phenylpyruvate tautomerase PptA (4-oxalocrotonate tautomerase family)
MGMHRSDGFVLVQVTFNVGRTTEQKVALYDRAAQLLAEAAGVSPDEVFINLVEVQREKWSFETTHHVLPSLRGAGRDAGANAHSPAMGLMRDGWE